MKTIPLTQGQVALVDDVDFDAVSKFRWHSWWNKATGSFYAKRHGPRPEQRTIYLHRAIMGEPAGLKVDHRNHDTLDNRRGNLRAVTNSQNQMNRRGADRDSRSQVRGVSWFPKTMKWRAKIRVGGKQLHLGYFDLISDASRAYQEANLKHFGEFGGSRRIP